MKIGIVGFGFFSVIILAVVIVMSLGKDNRENERLAEVVELVIYQSLTEGVERVEDPGEIFVDNIEAVLSEEEYSVTIIASDCEKGILSVLVELGYSNMGKERTTEVIRTVIYENFTG